MQITVSGKQIELSDVLRTQVWEHLDTIGKRYRDLVRAQVTFSRERRFFTCEITLHGNGMRLRSEAGAADAYVAFRKTMAPLAERLAEARSRRYDRRSEPTENVIFRDLLRPEDEQ